MKVPLRKKTGAAEPPAPARSRAAKRQPVKPKASRGQKFILAVGDEGGILVFLQGKKVVRRLFAPSPQRDHTSTLVELMQANPKVPLYILADVLDQQYARHNFPPVSAFSVGGLVKRRLERDFQAEDMKGSLPLGRDKAGRKEWNFLLIALANTALMQQWLDLVVELPNEFKGIYLTPVEGQNYLPTLRKALPIASTPTPWQLMVTHNKISGFRQIVLKDGKLVFTRATQAIDDALPAVSAGNIEQEILNTLEYLRRLGFQENATLQIIVITATEVKEALDLKRFNAASAHLLTPLDVADMLGLEQAALSADRFGDVVMAASFGVARKHALKFMTAYGKRLEQLYLMRRVMIAIAALAVVTLTFFSVSNVVQAVSDSSAISSLDKHSQPLEAQLHVLQKSIDDLDVDVAYKSAIVSAYDVYMKNVQSPLTFVKDLAPLLTTEIRALSVSWGPKTSGSNAASGAPPAAGDANAGPPLEIKVAVEFMHPFQDVDELSKAVQDYLVLLRQKLPQYHIATGTLPWLSSSGEQSMEISFNQEGKNGIHEGMNTIDFYFWPQPVAPQATSASPPGAPKGRRP